MCVDSMLLKFYSDEKQFIRLFKSVFASDCCMVVALCGGVWAQRAWIEMIINIKVILCQ